MATLEVAVVSVLPEMFDALGGAGIAARAMERAIIRLRRFNPRDYTSDKHRTVDDRPYGGGPGMVMMVEPLRLAIAAARGALGEPCHVVHLSPQGQRLDHNELLRLAQRRRLILLCGRYEGIDERLIELEVDQELSIGDYVLSGGELAAMVLIEATARLLPGALGCGESAAHDSFAGGLLDCPHYSRPECVAGKRVPGVLLSGNHEAIRRWRMKQSVGRTWQRRPDLLDKTELSDEQRALLDEFVDEIAAAPGRAAEFDK